MSGGGLELTGLGQVGVILRGPGGTLCIDPYLTDNGGGGEPLPREFPPPVDPSRLEDVDLVLVTHEHIDHFDPRTLEPLAEASPRARFAGPHTCDFTLAGIDDGRVLAVAAFEPLDVATAVPNAEDLTITPVPSAHTELEKSERGYPYLGWIIEWGGIVVYHAGDTVIYGEDEATGTPGLLDTLGRWSIDVMFIPINGRDWFRTRKGLVGNTDAREAAMLAKELDVGLVIPTHYDLVAENGSNPAHFVDILYRLDPGRPHHLLRPGETFRYSR